MTRTYRTKKIVQRDPQGGVVKVYDSAKHAAESCGVFTSKQLYNHLYHSAGALWHGYYWEWNYGEDVATSDAGERQCLGAECGRKFISRGAGNRFCPRCAGREGSNPFTYKVHGDVEKS